MIIKKYNESAGTDLVWLYHEEEIRNVLGLWVANGMVGNGFDIVFNMRNHHLNNRMSNYKYKPKDQEMAAAYFEIGYVPCIELNVTIIDDIRVVITELNSLLRHMPEYHIYSITNNGSIDGFGILLKQVDYPRHEFKIQNRVLAEGFTQFKALGFNPVIQKVNIDHDDLQSISRTSEQIKLLAIRNISSTNWVNPHYVITFETRGLGTRMDKNNIKLLGRAAELFDEYSIRMAGQGEVILEEFRLNNPFSYFVIIIRE